MLFCVLFHGFQGAWVNGCFRKDLRLPLSFSSCIWAITIWLPFHVCKHKDSDVTLICVELVIALVFCLISFVVFVLLPRDTMNKSRKLTNELIILKIVTFYTRVQMPDSFPYNHERLPDVSSFTAFTNVIVL